MNVYWHITGRRVNGKVDFDMALAQETRGILKSARRPQSRRRIPADMPKKQRVQRKLAKEFSRGRLSGFYQVCGH